MEYIGKSKVVVVKITVLLSNVMFIVPLLVQASPPMPPNCLSFSPLFDLKMSESSTQIPCSTCTTVTRHVFALNDRM